MDLQIATARNIGEAERDYSSKRINILAHVCVYNFWISVHPLYYGISSYLNIEVSKRFSSIGSFQDP